MVDGNDTIVQRVGDVEDVVVAEADTRWADNQRGCVCLLREASTDGCSRLDGWFAPILLRHLQVEAYNGSLIDDVGVG